MLAREEWGVPERDSRALWEKLMLDGFQAGLSWITILRKREAFSQAFHGFEPEVVARFGPANVARTAKALGDKDPRRSVGKAELPVDEMQATIEEFYRERTPDETPAVADLPLDVDLDDLFGPAAPQGSRPAAEFLAEHRKMIVDKITYWTGVRRTLVKHLVESIEKRAKEMDLAVDTAREPAHLVEVVAYATTLVMNYLTRGRFTEK